MEINAFTPTPVVHVATELLVAQVKAECVSNPSELPGLKYMTTANTGHSLRVRD